MNERDINSPIMDIYFNWMVKETNNKNLSRDDAGVVLSLKLLSQLDPFELFDDRIVKSESIEGMSQTFEVNDEGIPLKVLRWLRPYYMVGSLE